MSRIDNAVRDALADLAEQAAPVNLGAEAVAGARRHRRRVVAGAVIAAVALVAAVGVPLAASGHLGHRAVAPAGTPSSTGPGPVRLPKQLVRVEGFDVTSWSSGDSRRRSVVYDRAHHKYISVSYGMVVPAPKGTLVAVGQYDPKRLVGLLDTATGRLRPLTVEGDLWSAPEWSPDGSKLLVPVQKDRNNLASDRGYVVVDATTGQHRVHWVPQDPRGSIGPFAHWHPDGSHVMLPVDDPTREAEAVGFRFQLYDLDGNPTGVLLPAVRLDTGWQAWSPDRRNVIALGMDRTRYGGSGDQYSVIDVGTAHATTRLPHDDFGGWWTDDRHVLVSRTSIGAHGSSSVVFSVVDLDGKVVRSHPLAGYGYGNEDFTLYRHQ